MDVVTLALAKKYADAHSGSAGSAYVFETKVEMEEWVAANSDKLKIGDSLYIIQKDVPDYWWDGNQLQELETKIDLTTIAKESTSQEILTNTNTIIQKIDEGGGGSTFNIENVSVYITDFINDDINIFAGGLNSSERRIYGQFSIV